MRAERVTRRNDSYWDTCLGAMRRPALLERPGSVSVARGERVSSPEVVHTTIEETLIVLALRLELNILSYAFLIKHVTRIGWIHWCIQACEKTPNTP